MEGLLAIEDGLLAVGEIQSLDRGLRMAIWRSSDGRSWDRIDLADVGGTMSDVIRWRDGYVAVGSSFDGGDGGLIWTSRDGTVWTRATGVGLKRMRLRDAAVSADRLVIVGENDGTSLVVMADLPD